MVQRAAGVMASDRRVCRRGQHRQDGTFAICGVPPRSMKSWRHMLVGKPKAFTQDCPFQLAIATIAGASRSRRPPTTIADDQLWLLLRVLVIDSSEVGLSVGSRRYAPGPGRWAPPRPRQPRRPRARGPTPPCRPEGDEPPPARLVRHGSRVSEFNEQPASGVGLVDSVISRWTCGDVDDSDPWEPCRYPSEVPAWPWLPL